jgi:polar amino acid transport system substrate-binding protein
MTMNTARPPAGRFAFLLGADVHFAYLIEPPFNDRAPDGTPCGSDIDLAGHIFQTLGLPDVTFTETTFAQLLPGLADGRWQMTTGLFITDDRRRTAMFSRPIWALPDGLLVRIGNPLALSGYASIAAHPTATLAVIQGQVQQMSAAQAGISPDRLRIFETYTEAAHAVASGECDAYASVARAHTGFLAASPGVPLAVVTVPPGERPPAPGAFAFARSDTALRDAVDQALTRYLGSAPHRVMMAGYGFTAAEIDPIL